MLENTFAVLGLGEEEARTYLKLLETGPLTVGKMAQLIGKPRPSLYGFLRRLQEKGVIAQSERSGVRVYIAEAPEKIDLLFQNRLTEVAREQREYRKVLPDLRKKIPSPALSPKFQLYEGSKGVQFVLRDMLLYRNIQTSAFWPIKSMVDILSPGFFREHNKERIRRNIYTRAIWPSQKVVSIKDHPYLGAGDKFRREIRIAPKNMDFSMGYWVYGNKAAFISSRKESFGFIIESRELAEMLLSQFEVVWELSKPLSFNAKDAVSFLEDLRSAAE